MRSPGVQVGQGVRASPVHTPYLRRNGAGGAARPIGVESRFALLRAVPTPLSPLRGEGPGVREISFRLTSNIYLFPHPNPSPRSARSGERGSEWRTPSLSQTVGVRRRNR